jgi:hypothetical protein
MNFRWLKEVRQPLQQFNGKAVVLGVAAWMLVFNLQSCTDGPRYLATALAAITVCVVLWTNHLSMAPVIRIRDAAKLVGIGLYDLFSIFVLVIFASIPFSLVHVDCYNSRHKVLEMILASATYRSQMLAW